ncbi:MAG: 3-deoxy-7-phosphoheptulonate synthase [Candidatus Sericytochromatia bacterium]|nr:3-deoxy-7-phosphoheptulonate synthase [Candidatus Sericytochromatia bacterium]
MIIVMAVNASEPQVQHVLDRVGELGFQTTVSRGVERIVIGLIGDESRLNPDAIRACEGVNDVMPVSKPFKVVNREFQPHDTIVTVGDVTFGGDGPWPVIAGPCSVETPEMMIEVAHAVKASGATMLRGGAFKPRTSPYAFQGHGELGLQYLDAARKETGLPFVTEIVDPADVGLVSKYADMLQIGARNMQNFALLKAVGRSHRPVMLKRGLSSSIDEWLMAAEYIASEGNTQIVLCERGIRSSDNQYTRNVLDLAAIPVVKKLSHLPVIVDPSHGTGKRYLVSPMAQAGLTVGAHGLMVEVHPRPEEAWSDGPQSLTLELFAELMRDLRALEASLNSNKAIAAAR